ncbi:MAG: site-2 protease family protein [Oscillospiraceae bacterium]
MAHRQELLAALAGPLVNLVCGALFGMRSPAFAAYSLMLGIYNLLPVWPLDGGRAVRCALAQHLPLARAEAVSRRSSFAVCAALLLAGIDPERLPPRLAPAVFGMVAYLTLRLLTLAKRTGE